MNPISSTNTNLVLNMAFYTSEFTAFELVIGALLFILSDTVMKIGAIPHPTSPS